VGEKSLNTKNCPKKRGRRVIRRENGGYEISGNHAKRKETFKTRNAGQEGDEGEARGTNQKKTKGVSIDRKNRGLGVRRGEERNTWSKTSPGKGKQVLGGPQGKL